MAPAAPSFSELLEAAEADELIWAALVEHVDGRVVLVGWDGNAALSFDVDEDRQDFAEWLLVDGLVPCDEAARCAIDALDDCERCAPVFPAAA